MLSHSHAEIVELIQAARAGSSDALGKLLQGYRNYLQLIADLQMRSQFRDKFSPSDVVQATFVQAHRGFAGFVGGSEGELLAWLRKILVSQLLMEMRRYSSQQRDVRRERDMHALVDQSSLHLAQLMPAHDETPSRQAMRRERAVLLADALGQLSELHREIIVLRHLQGLPFAAIAEQTGRTVDSVKGHWRRSIAHLRNLLEENLT